MAVAAPSFCPAAWNLSFGDVAAKKSATHVLNLTNCGNATLSLKSIVSSAATVTTTNSCATVNAGSTCALSVKFSPRDSSLTSAALIFNDNAAISPQIVNVAGQWSCAATFSIIRRRKFWAFVAVSTGGVGNTLLFWNYGNAPLVISSVSVDGDFSVSQDLCIGTVQPNSPCSITVTFSPTAGGIRTGTLTIASNDPVYPRAGISLNGTGDTVYAGPVITSLRSPTFQINNGTLTLQFYAANIYHASLVEVNTENHKPQPTLAVDNSRRLWNPPLTTAIGEISVSVFNPIPGGGTTVAMPLTRYNVVNVNAAFVTSVPGSTYLYASIPSSAKVKQITVVSIYTFTGALGKPIPVGKNPESARSPPATVVICTWLRVRTRLCSASISPPE